MIHRAWENYSTPWRDLLPITGEAKMETEKGLKYFGEFQDTRYNQS